MLRRPTDLLEDVVAWLLGAAAVLACGIALVAALTGFTAGLQRSHVETATRTPAVATVAADARSAPVSVHGIAQLRASATVTWTAPDGTTGMGTVLVPPGTAAGAAVPIWVTRDGAVTNPPISPAYALGAGLASGLAVLVLGAGLISGAWFAVRRATSAINACAWDREWALLEPQWRNLLP